MPSLTPLQQLRRLDRLSPQFPNQLTSLLREQEYGDYVTSLQDHDLSWLVEYLDDVLDALHPSSPAFQVSLCELRAICGSRRILPQSHMLPASLLNTAERPVASNGSCDVYEDLLDGSKVCVKRLRIYSMEGPTDVKRAFCHEAVVWKRLTHPNIVPFLGATFTPFQSISVWMSGGELSEYISTHPCPDRLGLLSDVADGLSYLHSHSLIHGDLKGPSILVDDTGRARLTDFCFAGIASDPGPATSIIDGHAVRWAAPEVLGTEGSVSRESDVYSWAMVVIEVFTGKVPFHNSIPATVVVDVLSGDRPDRPADPRLTDDLWDLVRRCWDHDPQRRPGITEVVLRLRTLSADADLDGTTLGSVRQEEISSGSRYQPSRLATASYKLQRLWKLAKFSLASRPAPGKGPAHGAGSEEDVKCIDAPHSHSSASGLLRRTGGWFSKYKARPTRNRHGRPNGLLRKQEMVLTGGGVPSTSSWAKNHPFTFKRFLMRLVL